MSKKSITPNRLKYKSQIKRIRNIINRAKKRGYEFEETYIQEISRMPQRVTTQAIERISRIRPENIYARANYRTVEGDIITGTKRRTQERQEAALRGKQRKAKSSIVDIASDIAEIAWTKTDRTKDIEEFISEKQPQITGLENKLITLYNEWVKLGSPNSFKNWLQLEHPEIFDFEDISTKPKDVIVNVDDTVVDFKDMTNNEQPQPALPKEEDLFISHFFEEIKNLTDRVSDEKARNDFIAAINKWYNENVGKYGRNAVAKMLKAGLEAGLYFSFADVYGDQDMYIKMDEFLKYIGADEAADIIPEMEDDFYE